MSIMEQAGRMLVPCGDLPVVDLAIDDRWISTGGQRKRIILAC